VIAAAAIILLIFQYKNILRCFFPLKYANFITMYSEDYNLDPYLVCAIINVESHYDPHAQSQKDARGLMQVTVSTGSWAAQQMGLSEFNERLLFQPEINIMIGCWYLDSLRQEFGRDGYGADTKLILAAYNGGSGNVKKWLKNEKYSKTGFTLELIPFKETREYIDKVLTSYRIYLWLYDDL
jgi:soluble lytic murein transglycosylase